MAVNQHQQHEKQIKQAAQHNRLQGLWRLMGGFRGEYAGAVASLALATGARTLTFLLLAWFIDTYLVADEKPIALYLIALGFVGLAVIQGVFTFYSGKLAASTSEGIVQRLRNYMLNHIQRLTFAYHDTTSTGELIQRATSDIDAIRRFFAEQAIETGRIIMLFVVNLAAIMLIDVQLALISVAVIPVVLVLSFFFFRKVSDVYERYQEQEAILSSALQENLSGVRVVKAFARQPYEEERFGEINGEMYRRGQRLLLMHSLYWPFSDILCGFQMLAGFTVGALMAINGRITVGEYLAYAGMIIWIIWPIRNLGRMIIQMSTGMVSFGRVAQVVREEREDLETGDTALPARVKGKIEYRDAGFTYTGTEQPVLTDISFTARPGQRIALLGATGAGKTSLINLLPRFYNYTSGEILLDDVPLTSYSRSTLRHLIGIVEQEPFLFSRTVRDNITYGVGRAVSQAEVEEAARFAAIHEVIVNKFPDGYNTLVGERGTTLSGGQKQRVAIARTLLKDPRILILDDSTSAVDTETEALIRTALEALMAGRTTFIIAHRIQSLMSADLILVMKEGRIVQRGTHAELVNQPGMYRNIYAAQTRMETELEEELTRVRTV
ncbi:MAG: ABC transporter ATP-binding protein [Caldilineaceae bacterium]|nr:ABC transporter ATP-binding protein [Caldilineaceae bacterium]